MARLLFPAFLDLVGRRVLVVGGGRVALAKVVRVLDAGADVVVVAPSIARDLECLAADPPRAHAVEIHRRPFQAMDLEGMWYVIAAAPSDVNV